VLVASGCSGLSLLSCPCVGDRSDTACVSAPLFGMLFTEMGTCSSNAPLRSEPRQLLPLPVAQSALCLHVERSLHLQEQQELLPAAHSLLHESPATRAGKAGNVL